MTSSRSAPGIETGCDTLGRSTLTPWWGVGNVMNASRMMNTTIAMTLANCSVLKSLKSPGDVRDFRTSSILLPPPAQWKVTAVTSALKAREGKSFSGRLLPLCQQPDFLHARVMRQIDHVGDVQEIHVGVAAHERNFFR